MAPEPRSLSEIYQQIFTSYQFSFLTKQSHVKYSDVMAVGEEMEKNPSTLTPVPAQRETQLRKLSSQLNSEQLCVQSRTRPPSFTTGKKILTFETKSKNKQ
jgi:hypothetical protein